MLLRHISQNDSTDLCLSLFQLGKSQKESEDQLQLHHFSVYHLRFDFFFFWTLFGTLRDFCGRLCSDCSWVCFQINGNLPCGLSSKLISLTLLKQQRTGCQELLEARRASFTKASSDLLSALLAVMAVLFCCHVIRSLCCFMCSFSTYTVVKAKLRFAEG